MRRVVSVWFPTLPTDRLRRPEEGQGSALDPQRADGPLIPLLGGWSGGGYSDLSPPRLPPPDHPPNTGVPRAARPSCAGTLRMTRGSGQRPDLPLVTVTGRVVMAANAEAAGLGLRPGMKLAQAQALVPGLEVHDADPDGDATFLRRLAAWCLRYAPLAGVNPPDGFGSTSPVARTCMVEKRGCCAIWSIGSRRRGLWRGLPLPIRRLSRMRWLDLALAVWCPRARMSWPGSRSRRCVCRPIC